MLAYLAASHTGVMKDIGWETIFSSGAALARQATNSAMLHSLLSQDFSPATITAAGSIGAILRTRFCPAIRSLLSTAVSYRSRRMARQPSRAFSPILRRLLLVRVFYTRSLRPILFVPAIRPGHIRRQQGITWT